MLGAVAAAVPVAVDPAITTAITGVFDDGKTLILTVLAVAFFGILLAVTAVKVGGNWAKRSLNQ